MSSCVAPAKDLAWSLFILLNSEEITEEVQGEGLT